jgi:hypothetical protein
MTEDDMRGPGLKTHLLIAALVFATLFIGALTLRARHTAFPPHFRGFGELTPRGEVAGWAVNSARPSEPVEVQLYVDGRFVAHQLASAPRPDVVAAGRAADERCGYVFPLPTLSPGAHEARVYALHAAPGDGPRTLQQLGHALRFASP